MLPTLSSPRFVLLASGLGLGSGSGESLLGTQLLVDAVTGQLGAEGQQSCAALISRVILAGNLLSQSTQSRDSLHKVLGGPAKGWARGWGGDVEGSHRLPATAGPVLDEEDAGCERGSCEDAG